MRYSDRELVKEIKKREQKERKPENYTIFNQKITFELSIVVSVIFDVRYYITVVDLWYKTTG